MADAQRGSLLRHLRQVLAGYGDLHSPDRAMLERFLQHGDEAAFEALVRRHGAMVLSVGRCVLRHQQDAEDVFQATFLLLARKGRSIRRQDSVASWLHGVAYRLALKARQSSGRRRLRENKPRSAVSATSADDLTWGEVQQVLHEELQRLPEKYRLPLMLCYLEGQWQDDAARQLGWPMGTLKGRLERGRTLLRTRLIRRGLGPAAALSATVLPAGATAALPGPLVRATVETVRLFGTGKVGAACGVSAQVATLVQEGVPMMGIGKVKIVVAAVVLGALLTGAGVLARSVRPAAPAEGPPQEVAKEKPEAAKEKPDHPRPADERRAHTDFHGDPLPDDAVARLGSTRLLQGGYTSSVVFSHDGRSVASCGTDGTVHIWDAATGKERARLEGVGDSDRTGPALHTMGKHPQHLAFAPDGKTLAAAWFNGPPCLWDVSTGKKIRELAGPETKADWVVFAPDGKTLAFGRRDYEMGSQGTHLVDVASGEELQWFKEALGVPFAWFSPDGKILAMEGSESKVRFWDVETGKKLRECSGNAVAWAPDSKTAAVGVLGKTVRLVEIATGKEVDTGKQFYTGTDPLRWRPALVFSPDGETLAGAGPFVGPEPKGTIWLWDVGRGKERNELSFAREERRGWSAPALLFTADGKTLVSQHLTCVRFWDLATGKQLFQYEGSGSIGLSPDGRTLAMGTGTDKLLTLLEVPSGKPLILHHGHQGPVAFVVFAPDGKALATGSQDGTVRVWGATGKQLHEFRPAGPSVFTPDGKSLVSYGWEDGKVRVWDLSTGKEVRQFQAHAPEPGQNAVQAVALSRDGKTLVTCRYRDQSLCLWDLPTGKQLHNFGGKQKDWPQTVALAADGKTLASVHSKGGFTVVLHLWEVATGKHLCEISGEKDGKIVAPAFSSDGKIVAAVSITHERPSMGTADYTVCLWDTATGKELRRLPEKPVSREDAGRDSLAFSPDDRTLAWGQQRGVAPQVWEIRTGKVRREFHGFRGGVLCVGFSPDGTLLASGSADGTALLWDISGAHLARPGQNVQLTAKEFNTLWADLEGEDAVKAEQAMRTCTQSSEQAVALVQRHLPSVVDARRLAQLIGDLDSEDFSARENATKELEKLAAAAEPALRKALEGNPSVEMRRRIERLLEPRSLRTERVRTERSIELLERLGTPEARQVLETLAKGPPEYWFTQDAKGSVERLAKRRTSAP
jgi:RNA polymerase sigma factor (sigma-70 family)